MIAAHWLLLARMPFAAERWSWGAFALPTLLWTADFGGVTHSFYPSVVPDRQPNCAAASTRESPKIILFGTLHRAADDPAAYGAGL